MCGTHQKALVFQSDFPMTTLPRWWIDCWSNYQISTAMATSCYQGQAHSADGFCLNSILFDRQWHTSHALSASHSWCHKLYGAVLLCLTGRGLTVSLDQRIIWHSQIKGVVCHMRSIRNYIPLTQFQPPGCFPLLKHLGICQGFVPAGFCVPWYRTGSWDTANALSTMALSPVTAFPIWEG